MPRSARRPLLGSLPAAAVLLVLSACGGGSDDGVPAAPVVTGEPLGVAGAHEHGVASLGVAVDGMQVTLDLTAPAASVFGFERAPRSEEERASMTAALERLRTGAGDLVAFPEAAGCGLESVQSLDAPEIPPVSEAGTDDHADDHDHDHEHAHEDDDDDGHDHASDVDGEGEPGGADAGAADHTDDDHQDVRLVATLRCSTAPMGTARLTLAGVLADLERVDLTVVTAGGQAAARVESRASFEL